MLKTGFILVAAASALCLGGTANLALGDETANHPAGLCTATGDDELTLSSDGEARNDSTVKIDAICPARRSMSPLARYIRGLVFAVDRHPSANVCCRVRSKNPSGATVSGVWRCTSGSSTGYQILDLPEIYDGYSWSHFYLQCQVPPKYGSAASRLQMFRTIQH